MKKFKPVTMKNLLLIIGSILFFLPSNAQNVLQLDSILTGNGESEIFTKEIVNLVDDNYYPANTEIQRIIEGDFTTFLLRDYSFENSGIQRSFAQTAIIPEIEDSILMLEVSFDNYRNITELRGINYSLTSNDGITFTLDTIGYDRLWSNYDNLGNPIFTISEASIDSITWDTIGYKEYYYADGKLDSLIDNNLIQNRVTTITFDYDESGRILQRREILESSNPTVIMTSIFSYFEDQRIENTDNGGRIITDYVNGTDYIYKISNQSYDADTDSYITNFSEDYYYTVVNPSSSVDRKQNQLHIYPNPATNTLSVKNATPGTTYRILNLIGKQVQIGEFDDTTINISSLPYGQYFLRSVNNQRLSFIKL